MCRRMIGLALIGACLQGVQSGIAVAGEPCSKAFDALFSTEVITRREAFRRIRVAQQERTAEVLRRLGDKATWEDRTYEGRASTLCDVAGLYRMEDCATTLAKHIGFTLDHRTFPPMRVQTAAYYPVARALARIGGRAALDAVAPLLRKESGELLLRESTWILRECLGKEGAKAWISATVRDQKLKTDLLQWTTEGVILPPAWR